MQTTALAPWFGSNRMLAKHVAEELAGCRWVGVPFAGGMCELAHITAPSIVVSDLHRHVINLALVVQSDELRPRLIDWLTRLPFHPDVLAQCQERCRDWENAPYDGKPCLPWACDYFVTCWMGRSHKAGIDDQFNGGLSIRWNGNGGDSNTRYRSAIRSLVEWGRIMRRCNFSVADAFEVIERCEDEDRHGLYLDPPFPGPGDRYKHNCGDTEAEQATWHKRLYESVSRFKRTRVVCRFYNHHLIESLYCDWTWRYLKGRKQSNGAAPEVLLINGPSLCDASAGRGLFA